MKRTILLIAIALITFTGFSQAVQIQTMYDTVRSDGQRFVITWPYGLSISLIDSLYIPEGDSVLQKREGWYSQNHSTATYKIQRKRIVPLITTPVTYDSLIRYEQVTVPFSQLGVNISQLLTGTSAKKALKPTCKLWIKYKLSQE